jgi:hypothetical protein
VVGDLPSRSISQCSSGIYELRLDSDRHRIRSIGDLEFASQGLDFSFFDFDTSLNNLGRTGGLTSQKVGNNQLMKSE